MAKRKYTRSGDKAAAYECTKKSCKWQGTDSEKSRKQTESGWLEHVCPECGNNEFYGLLENPKPQPKFKVELEDNGQDFLEFLTDEKGVIIEAKPFLTEIWKGGVIPVESQRTGEFCMMHKPPHINFGFLKHKVIKIEKITDASN